jgi:hypothetical protein
MAYENVYKRPLKHYVAIAVGNDERYQAVCNPIKCGWKGSVTHDRSMAEFEREIHYIEILDLDTRPFPQ